ncbi:MAG: amidophosphoribosyltransferase [Muribaculaceae bacterium]|jgi:amidophosphoribosyltransferase|nr:amidophosphoribosyltransferase [Muribaculaceae bacterium]
MEVLKHECGIAMIRLRKPLSYYKDKYGTCFYGLNKLYLMMEKQHNRGQEGAGLGCVKMNAEPGNEYIFRERALGSGAIQEIFANVKKQISASVSNGTTNDEDLPFAGEVYMGHLRYSTTGRSGMTYVHPFLRRNNWKSRNLMICGNFNMTNVDEIFQQIVNNGQHPRVYSDTVLLLESLGHSLDNENQHLFDKYSAEGHKGIDLTRKIEDSLDITNILKEPSTIWDGGYVICGVVGSGDFFVLRDPNGIRPAFFYYDDEIAVVASERPVIQTAMNVTTDQVTELRPGSAITVSKSGEIKVTDILGEGKNERCSFERIYFSRGCDRDIYIERKKLGMELAPTILKSVDYDIKNTVFSFIPNTAETAYIGLMEGIEKYIKGEQKNAIEKLDKNADDYDAQLTEILNWRVRAEKVVLKDIKLRTFIAEGEKRNDLAGHVYDVTYGIVRPNIDNLVVIDDSIVRGTTLKQSIIRILDRLSPKKIVVVSSSPQIRYPDYYGIDMSRMTEFAAFRAAVELLKDRGMTSVIDEVYKKCKEQENLPKEQVVNYVTKIYEPFTDVEVSAKIGEMLTPADSHCEVEIVYQTIEGLHKSIPDNKGDWYFSGNYPTPGGNRMVNRAFINYYEGNPLKRC